MIAKGVTHAQGARLASYLITGKNRESAQLFELRGFALLDIVDAFRSVQVMARATKCVYPFFHVAVRNPDGESLDSAQWNHTADAIEQTLGLVHQPRAIAFHTCLETGARHMHVAWSRIDQDSLTAKPLSFFKERLKRACRELEQHFGLTEVSSVRTGPIAYAPTRQEEEQSRRLGINLRDHRETIRNCFDRSDHGRSFRAALAENDLVLAQGERRDFVVVDRAGGLHALGKRILGVSAAKIRTRLDDLRRDELPTVDQARRSRTLRSPAASASEAKVDFAAVETPMMAVASTRSSPAVSEAPEISCNYSEEGRAAGHEANIHAPVCSSATPEPFLFNSQVTATPLGLGDTCCRDPVPATDGAVAVKPVRNLLEAAPLRRPRDVLREKFRSLVKHLGARSTTPSPKPRRRRRDEGGRSFKAFAITLLRRVTGTPVIDPLDPSWDAFTWHHFWGYNDASSLSQDCAVSPPSSVHHL